jgi:hypothetical protein
MLSLKEMLCRLLVLMSVNRPSSADKLHLPMRLIG